jgi:hypothetical protein
MYIDTVLWGFNWREEIEQFGNVIPGFTVSMLSFFLALLETCKHGPILMNDPHSLMRHQSGKHDPLWTHVSAATSATVYAGLSFMR